MPSDSPNDPQPDESLIPPAAATLRRRLPPLTAKIQNCMRTSIRAFLR
jgi:hypothetical protein